MKASELIKELERFIEKHGDLRVRIRPEDFYGQIIDVGTVVVTIFHKSDGKIIFID